jgi:hypothetical protein
MAELHICERQSARHPRNNKDVRRPQERLRFSRNANELKRKREDQRWCHMDGVGDLVSRSQMGQRLRMAKDRNQGMRRPGSVWMSGNADKRPRVIARGHRRRRARTLCAGSGSLRLQRRQRQGARAGFRAASDLSSDSVRMNHYSARGALEHVLPT